MKIKDKPKKKLMKKKTAETKRINIIKNTNDRVSELIKTIPLKDLNNAEENSILEIFKENAHSFFIKGDGFTGTNSIQHTITLANEKPVYTKQYRIADNLKTEFNRQIQEMFDNNIITECRYSPYNNPVFLVPKKSTNKEK